MSVAAMAQMSPELRKRVFTGAVGALALVLLIVYGGLIGIFLVATVISLAMINEFSEMVFALPDRTEKRYALLLAGWLIALGTLILAHSEYEILISVFLILTTYFLVTARRNADTLNEHFKELMFSVFGALYLAFLPTFLPKIHEGPNGVQWTVLFLLLNWSTDTGAYFAGKKFGKHCLYPLISPKKSREGAIGGIATALFVTLAFKLTLFRAIPWAAVIILPPLVSVLAQVGDLSESFLKRAFGRKDSGSLLPGHGGFLDRFDGVVFSLPIMYALIRIFS